MRTRPLSLWIATGLIALQGGGALAAVIQTAQPDRITLQSGLLAIPLAVGLLFGWPWARAATLAFVGISFVVGVGLTALMLWEPGSAAVHILGRRVESDTRAIVGLIAALALTQAGWVWWLLRRPDVRAFFERTRKSVGP